MNYIVPPRHYNTPFLFDCSFDSIFFFFCLQNEKPNHMERVFQYVFLCFFFVLLFCWLVGQFKQKLPPVNSCYANELLPKTPKT